jgi:hypothetical protein
MDILIKKIEDKSALAPTRAILALGYFVALFHRLSGCPVLALLRDRCWEPALRSVVALSLILVTRSPRGLSWARLASIGLLFGTHYSVRFFDAYDWNRIEDLVPAIRPARRLISIG